MTTPKPSLFNRVNDGLLTVRTVLGNLLFILIVVLLLVFVLSSGGGPKVPDGAALILDPRGELVDLSSIESSLQDLLLPGSSPRQVELQTLLDAIDRARSDDRIRMLVLDLDELNSVSAAQADSLGLALTAFRDAGKRVVATGAYYDQGQYLVATHADALYLHPMGQLLLEGYGINMIYFKDLLSRLKVNIHVFRAGKYKEAVEPFLRADMSAEAREANQAVVDALWTHYRDRVAANRQLEASEVDRYSQDIAALVAERNGDLARVALEAHLVDELLTPDEVRARIRDRVGEGADGQLNAIGLRDYLAATAEPQRPPRGNQVAVIQGDGELVMGEGTRGIMGADSLVELIRRARLDEKVKALVLRVNSPGGSAFASELIRQELELTQLAGKPVVVSMADVAASGGYWISATADRILAQPTTVTGSIGVFAILPSLEESLAEIGVATDGVGTSELARSRAPLGPLEGPLQEVLQASVERQYERFLNLVARGRDMALGDVEAIAAGRIWTGAQALELGLVDALGDLDAAVDTAADLAGLDEWTRREIRRPLSPGQLLLRQLMENTEAAAPGVDRQQALTTLLRTLAPAAQGLDRLDDPLNSYALCEPCSLNGLRF